MSRWSVEKIALPDRLGVPYLAFRPAGVPVHVFKTPRQLSDCHNILDLRELAKRQLPEPLFHFLDGAAETEMTARLNTSSFDEDRLVPRCLVDVSRVNTSTQILGQTVEWPVYCSPTGSSRFFHPDGELAVAKAAAATGTLYSLSVMSTYSMEAVAAAANGPKLMQIYVFRDRDFTRSLIERAKRSGYKALCLTVDTAVTGKRERDLRTGLGVPPKLSMSGKFSFARRPRWVWGQVRKGPLSLENVVDRVGEQSLVAHSRFFAEQLDPSVSWKDVREWVELWGGAFALKGVLSVADAQRARDHGVSAVILSNHGGRQLDGAAAPYEVLPHVAHAVGRDLEVILDGGVRRGVHVLKALARGAKACSIGRAYLFGLSAGGEAGVSRSLAILKSEFVRAMQLAGCPDLASISPDLVRDAQSESRG